ncbi:interleukin-1 receptor type 2-like [Acanthochromis polyacanthus]|uniref:interleukin-1 receptor type 2-like n=1 Tax=Acanthochromis polyacanthus TaxID=80966 RepID=UPI00223476A7|nr:interleukin-1 receptor type 2-like [Acanthochromis polyacanthus]
MTTQKTLLVLPLLLTLLTGVMSSQEAQVLYARAGEMVVLECPYLSYKDGTPLWTNHSTQDVNVINSMSTSADVLIHGRSLVILRASINHQGNYSCSYGNASRQFWFGLTVYATQSREHGEKNQNPSTCYMQQSCRLICPFVNITPVNITRNGITWRKEGESSPQNGYFESISEKDSGIYTCTRSYLYRGQTYNVTFTVTVEVKPSSEILLPHKNDVFHVDLGSTVVINCTALVNSNFDDVFWLSGTSFVERSNSLPVFYNYTRVKNAEEEKLTASLVFQKISEEDLLRNYTCKLESSHQSSSFITITLTRKAHHFPLSLTVCIVAILVVIILTIVGAVILFRVCSRRKGCIRLHRVERNSSNLSTSWSRV